MAGLAERAALELEAIARALRAVEHRLDPPYWMLQSALNAATKLAGVRRLGELLGVVTDAAVGRAGPVDHLLVEVESGRQRRLGLEHVGVVAEVGIGLVGRARLGPIGLELDF